MYEEYKNSLENMTIYEYSERYKSDILKETQKNITVKSSKYEAYSYNSYKVTSNFTNYVCFKVHIKEDAIYTVQIFVKDFDDSKSVFLDKKDDDGKSKSYFRKLKSENKSNYEKNKAEKEEEKSFDFSLDETKLKKPKGSDIISM